jgi:hypothetical protein
MIEYELVNGSEYPDQIAPDTQPGERGGENASGNLRYGEASSLAFA